MNLFAIILFCIIWIHSSVQTFDHSISGVRNPLCQFLSAAVSRIPGCHSDPTTSTVVTTKAGKLRGSYLYSRNGLKYHAFLGIRYAEEPGRFEVAQPIRPWEGIRNADRYGSPCPQNPVFKVFMGREDCLFLNVFYPSEERCTEMEKLPVLFHIHGGTFKLGAGKDYGPKYLMDECIVYVSVNYRLGALGFLTTNDGTIPGNLGLKDALLALKWTKDNIEYFRGNPDSITINGISSGGAAVSHFIASPAAKGLFHRAIAQSGSALNDWAITYDPKETAQKLGELLGCNRTGTETSAELKECLLLKEAKEIVREQDSVRKWIFDGPPFAPVVEPENTENPFQTEHPYLRFKRGDVNVVPLITGVTAEEGILLYAIDIQGNNAAQKDLNNNWHEKAPLMLQYDYLNVSEEVRNNASDRIRAFYFGKSKTIREAGIQALINLESDRNFNSGIYEQALLYSKYAPVYHYVMTFEGTFSLTTLVLGLPYIAVSHGHDAQFLFKTMFFVPEPKGDSLKFSKYLIKQWVSFMQSGIPSANVTEEDSWRPFDETHQNTLKLDWPSVNVENFIRERMEFWQNIGLHELQFSQGDASSSR